MAETSITIFLASVNFLISFFFLPNFVFINCSATNGRMRHSCAKGMSIIEQIQGEFITPLLGRCPEKLQVSHHEYSNITHCPY